MLVYQKKCLSVDYNCRANLEEMAAPLLKRVDECMKRLASAVSKSTGFTLSAYTQPVSFTTLRDTYLLIYSLSRLIPEQSVTSLTIVALSFDCDT